MNKSIFIAALFLFALVSAHEPGPGEIDNSVLLTDENFDTLVSATGDDKWFIMFYAPWCGHCKKALPDWYNFATTAKGKVNVGRVDCTQQNELKTRFGIRGFPTILYLNEGKAYTYKGPRTIDGWTDFAENTYVNAAEIKDIPKKAGNSEL